MFTKLISLSELKEKFKDLKDKKIVFTNGCFDLLHLGHVVYLKKAKELGDVLVLGMNTDDSVRRLKGKNRPFINQNERAEVMSALSSIDFVVLFDEDTPLETIKEVCPDILVKGGDYNLDNIVGRDFVESTGGQVITIPFVKDKSSTNIIEKARAFSN